MSEKTVKLKQGIHTDCCKNLLRQGKKFRVSPSGAFICLTCYAAGVTDVPAVKV